MFNWAQPQSKGVESDEDAGGAEDSDSDPIANLLKSNTSVFQNRKQVLKQNTLDFHKVKNANTGHYH